MLVCEISRIYDLVKPYVRHCSLARVVPHQSLSRPRRTTAADVHHDSTFALNKVREDRSDTVEDTKYVDIEATGIIGLSNLQSRLVLVACSRVVYNNVERTQLGFRGCKCSIPVGSFRDVHLLQDDGGWVLLGELLGTGGVEITDEKFATFAGVYFADRETKA